MNFLIMPGASALSSSQRVTLRASGLGKPNQSSHCCSGRCALRLPTTENSSSRYSTQGSIANSSPRRTSSSGQVLAVLHPVGFQGHMLRVGVIKPTQPVLQVYPVILMPAHPGRILGRDHQVEVIQIQLGKVIIAVDDLAKVALGRGYFDQFNLMVGIAPECVQ